MSTQNFSMILKYSDLSNFLGELNSVSSVPSYWFFILGLVIVLVFVYFFNKNEVKAVQNISEQALKMQGNVLDFAQEQTSEMAEVARGKIDLVIEEYQKFLPYAEELGLKIDGFSIEAGVLPKVNTSLRGSIDNIKTETVERIKSENSQNKILIAILNAILLAKEYENKLESVYVSIFKDIIVDIQLGIPPAVSVRFE